MLSWRFQNSCFKENKIQEYTKKWLKIPTDQEIKVIEQNQTEILQLKNALSKIQNEIEVINNRIKDTKELVSLIMAF